MSDILDWVARDMFRGDGMKSDYAAFLAAKKPKALAVGIEPGDLNAGLFDTVAA